VNQHVSQLLVKLLLFLLLGLLNFGFVLFHLLLSVMACADPILLIKVLITAKCTLTDDAIFLVLALAPSLLWLLLLLLCWILLLLLVLSTRLRMLIAATVHHVLLNVRRVSRELLIGKLVQFCLILDFFFVRPV
jgi:hypothetical protein